MKKEHPMIFFVLMAIPVITKTASALASALCRSDAAKTIDCIAGPLMVSLYAVAFLVAILVSLVNPLDISVTSGLLAGLASAAVVTITTGGE